MKCSKMKNNNKTVRIFMLPLRFPCGPQSSCCGPIGQSEEEIQAYKDLIEKELQCNVEVIDVTNGKEMKNHLNIVRLVHSFGPTALPIITLEEEVVSMGNSKPEEAVMAIKEKMAQI